MEVIIMFLYMVGVFSLDKSVDYQKCKETHFKAKVCERYKELKPDSEK